MTADERAALMGKVRSVTGEAREAVRRALQELRREGRNVTVDAVRRAASVKREHAGYVLAAWRENLLDDAVSWARLDVVPPPPGKSAGAKSAGAPGAASAGGPAPGEPDVEALMAAIEATAGPSGIADVAQRVARLVAADRLDTTAARVILDACREQRQALMNAREVEPPPEDPTRMALVSDLALKVARAVDLLCNGRRRELVAGFCARMLNADMADFPNVDAGGVGAAERVDPMARLGLNARGEPIAGEDDAGLRVIAALEVPAAWERACRGELAAPGNA